MMSYQALNAIFMTASMGAIFDSYLISLSGISHGPQILPHSSRNSLVGFTESISGITCLVVLFPVGYIVDRWPKQRARWLRIAAVFGMIASILMIVGVCTDVSVLIFAGMISLGIFTELANSAAEAIFADSIEQGRRSTLYILKEIVGTVSAGCGPGLSVICLWFAGDTDSWKLGNMKAVIIAGLLMMPFVCVSLLSFKDPPAAGSHRSAVDSADENPQELLAAGGEQGLVTATRVTLKRCGPFVPKHVPYMLTTVDFITAIGAGMTVKFFYLFFIKDMHFDPIKICMLQMAYPLVIAVFMRVLQRVGSKIGRAQASLLFFSTNVLCFIFMSQVQSLAVLLVVFFIRGGFANSTGPLDRSILMDFTPSTQRGRWNAVSSLTSMTWSGSAFIGGFLADAHDYRFTFLITACVYTVACIMYSPLLGLVPRGEGAVVASA
eukprot:TRINITY_DN45149_c0_g1_i1.p1 TRINITY_DN45149_c0_g1~~TRINITY_DN45149_c0_g1_i1.p1  ORF type:complete len:489 (-),score=45.29 TRINITY_DN45149_c0_g1_i1:67-1377(-)